MKIYFFLSQVPELKGLGWRERGRLWRAAYWKTFRHWQTWLGILLVGACGGISSTFPSLFDGVSTGSLLGFSLFVGGIFIFTQVAIAIGRLYLREAVQTTTERDGADRARSS